MVPPLQEYLDHVQAKARTCSRACGQAAFLQKHRKQVTMSLVIQVYVISTFLNCRAA